MDIFVYSDESGVFDKVHNNVYVYGGIILLGKKEKDNLSHKYVKAEQDLRNTHEYEDGVELKAALLKPKHKTGLYRSMNDIIKFGVILNENKVIDEVFNNKKSKQRYLDFAYKIGLKKAFQMLELQDRLKLSDVERIYLFQDEHSSATDGRYELREGLENEFKIGTFNGNYRKFFPPICKNLKEIDLKFCNSATTTLVRAADIVANNIYYKTINNKIETTDNLILTYMP